MRHLPWSTAFLALAFSGALAAPGEPALEPARAREVLAPFTLTLPTGPVIAAGPGVLQIARRVRTDPGELPRLKVKAGDATLDLPLKHTQVFAELTGYVARVNVIQTYENPFDRPIEAIYVFPLPENAAVDDMKLTIGDRVIQADIRKRGEARRTYDDAKRAGHTAALLEQERPNVFTQSVANIAPGERIDVTLRYVQTLTYDAGEFEFVFPMVVGPRFIPGAPLAGGQLGTGWAPDTDAVPDASRITPPIVGAGLRSGHDISLEVLLDGGELLTDLQTPTHEVDARITEDGQVHVILSASDQVPNRDFVMRYRLDAEVPRAQVFDHHDFRGGFFSLVLHPPRLDLDRLVGQRELAFVIDVSGSMNGIPLGLAKDAVRRAVSQLGPDDTFNVYTFAGQTARAFEGPRPANAGNIVQALGFVDAARAGGGTFLADAVEEALAPAPDSGRHRYVFFLTDGYVGNEQAIFGRAEALVKAHARGGHKASVFCLGTGSAVNRHLLEGLAKAGRGLAQYLTAREDAAGAMNRIFRVIDHAVISDLRIDWGGLDVKSIEPNELPDLFATRPLVVTGRFDKGGSATVTVRGTMNDRPFRMKVPVTLHTDGRARGALPTLWARARVESLERRLWGGHDADAVAEIEKTGIAFRIVTAFTSFVAVDQSRVVGDGRPTTVVQPVEAPEAVDISTAAPASAQVFLMSGTRTGASYGVGGLGLSGSGGGGGGGVADAGGVGRLGTRGNGVGYGRGANGLGERASVAPRVRGGAPAVSGMLSADLVQRVFRRHTREIRSCYEKQLRKVPTLAGKVVLKLIIDALGKVISATISETTLKDSEVETCMAARAAKWVFPAHKGGGQAVITYPFVFKPGR